MPRKEGVPENLTPFKKGLTTNPKGRGKGHLNRATIARRWLDVKIKVKDPQTGIEEKGTVEDKIMLALIRKGLEGDVAAIREIFEMKYGKMPQPVDFSLVERAREVAQMFPTEDECAEDQ